MTRRTARRAILPVVLLAGLVMPAAASAWTVTVNVHGAGLVDETTNRNLMFCDVTPTGRSESSVTPCVAGSPGGLYASGDIVTLEASVPSTAFARGWRFQRWVDSNTGGGKINCDPQNVSGNHLSPTCTFQIWENLRIDLYFDDIHGPNATSIAGGPSGTTNQTSATFTFSASDDPDSRFDCRLDGPSGVGSFAPCGVTGVDQSESYSSLPDGQYTFHVRGRDLSFNNDETPATRTWTVDATGPVVSFTGGPAEGGRTNSATPRFEFAANEGATFDCAIDQGEFVPCASPYDTPVLGEGTHRLDVRGRDVLGNTGAAVTRNFTVDLQAPDTTILDGPAAGSTSPSPRATFTFASPESGATFECRIDDQPFAPCSSPNTLENVVNGDHTFEVRAVDAAGNADASPASRSWRVNTLDADADGINRPQDCNDADAAIRPGAPDTADDGVDQDCDGVDRINLDRDGDGTGRPQDCDDSNAAIRPGAADVPGNGRDEDCSGADAPLPPVSASIAYKFRVAGARTRMTVLRLTKVTPGATVTVACMSRRCPVRRRATKAPASGTLDLRRLLGKRPLPAGARLSITISAPGMISKVVTFAIRRGKSPVTGGLACLPPGGRRPVRC